MAGRNVMAIECKPIKDNVLGVTYLDIEAINKPGAYHVGMAVKTPDAESVPVTSICCPCGCGIHTSAWETPKGTPPSMDHEINIEYLNHKWRGQLLNGVWTETSDTRKDNAVD